MKARSGFRLAAELFGVAVVIAILLGGGVLLSLHWVAHIGSGGPDPIAVVDRDAGYRLDPPGARPVNDVEQGCGSTQLMMSRQFELRVAPAQVYRFYDRRLPELGWKEVPAVDEPGVSFEKHLAGGVVGLDVGTTPTAFIIDAGGDDFGC